MTIWFELDLDEIAEWPRLPKTLAILLIYIVIQSAGYCLWLQPIIDDIEQLKTDEMTLRSSVESQYHQIAIAPEINRQRNELNLRYEFLEQQLPEHKELGSMLSVIHQIGVKHKLFFTRMDWGKRGEHSFFYKLPLNIEATGQYHDIGAFSEAIVDLPRMVSLDVVDIQRSAAGSDMLHFRVMANTYQLKGEYE